MKLTKLLLFLFLLGGNAALATDHAASPDAACDTQLEELAKGNNLEVVKLAENLRSRTVGKPNPFFDTKFDGDHVGRAHKLFRENLPDYDTVLNWSKRQEQVRNLGPNRVNPDIKEVTREEFLKGKERLLKDIKNIVQDPQSSADKLFAASEALRLMNIVEAELPRDQKQIDEQKKQEQEEEKEKEKKKKEQKEEENDDSNPWGDPPDKYDPHNKDMDGDGSKKKPKIMLTTTAPVSENVMPDQYWDTITPEHIAATPLIRPVSQNRAPHAPKEGDHVTTIHTYGEREIRIPVQAGYEPVVGQYPSQGYNVVEKEPNIYYLEVTSAQVPKQVPLWLRDERPQSFKNPSDQALYQQPTGIKKDSWPEPLRIAIEAIRQKGGGPEQIAKHLKDYISKDAGYLYWAKGKEMDAAKQAKLRGDLAQLEKRYAKPVALAHLGAFQCDGASWIGASILRDFFGIPARIGGGFTVKKVQIDGKIVSMINANDPKHAWVQVWNGSRWVNFDMQPTKNLPEGEPSEDESIQDRNDEKRSEEGGEGKEQKDQQDQDGQERGKEGDKDKNKDKDGKEKGKEGEKDKDGKEKGKDGDKDKDGENKDGKEGDQKSDSNKGGGKPVEIQDTLVSKDVARDPHKRLASLVFDTVEVNAVERIISDDSRRRILGEISAAIRNLRKDPFENFADKSHQDVRAVYDHMMIPHDKGIVSWIGAINTQIRQGQLRDAWVELKAMREMLIELHKRRNLTDAEKEVAQNVEKVLAELRRVKHPNSAQFDLVDRVMRTLPGNISRSVLLKMYGNDATVLGSLAQETLAKDLISGKLAPIVRMSLLKPYLDTVLQSERTYRTREDKLFQRSLTPKHDQDDLVMARSPLEYKRMILQPKPGEHLFAPTIEGKQFMLDSRETHTVSDPTQPVERRQHELFQDVSPSMNPGSDANVKYDDQGNPIASKTDVATAGDRTLIADSFVMAYVDFWMSKMDVMKRPLDEIEIFRFADIMIGEGIVIKTREDAEKFIRLKLYYATLGGGAGTNVQVPLEKFYDRVIAAFAERSLAKTKFQKANCILISDEGSAVDKAAIEAKRALLPEGVTTNLNFINVEAELPAVRELAESSNTKTQKSLYHFLDVAKVQEIMNASRNLQYDKDAFASSLTSAQIPPSLHQAMGSLSRSARGFITPIPDSELNGYVNMIQGVKQDTKKMLNPSIVTELDQVTKLLTEHPGMPRDLKRLILFKMLKEYPRLSGRRLDALTYTERDLLVKLVDWARRN